MLQLHINDTTWSKFQSQKTKYANGQVVSDSEYLETLIEAYTSSGIEKVDISPPKQRGRPKK